MKTTAAETNETEIDILALFAEVEAEMKLTCATDEKHVCGLSTERRYCKRCCGQGIIPGYWYVQGGVCFECNGRDSSWTRTPWRSSNKSSVKVPGACVNVVRGATVGMCAA